MNPGGRSNISSRKRRSPRSGLHVVWTYRFAAFAAFSALAAQATACEVAQLLSPERGSTISEARPTLEWRPIPGQERYRIQLRSRVPEGEVLVALDTTVHGTRFSPPRPLTDHRAIVRVAVSAACEGEAPTPDDFAPFFIDTSPLCIIGPLQPDAATPNLIVWESVPNAVEYESYFYEMPEGALAAKTVSRDSAVREPRELKRPAVVATRPRCTTGFGEMQYLLLP